MKLNRTLFLSLLTAAGFSLKQINASSKSLEVEHQNMQEERGFNNPDVQIEKISETHTEIRRLMKITEELFRDAFSPNGTFPYDVVVVFMKDLGNLFDEVSAKIEKYQSDVDSESEFYSLLDLEKQVIVSVRKIIVDLADILGTGLKKASNNSKKVITSAVSVLPFLAPQLEVWRKESKGKGPELKEMTTAIKEKLENIAPQHADLIEELLTTLDNLLHGKEKKRPELIAILSKHLPKGRPPFVKMGNDLKGWDKLLQNN